MALKLAELFVQITGNDRPLQQTLAGVRQGLLGLKGLAAAAGTAIAGAGLAAGMASLVGQAISMEDALAGLSKATDLEGAALEKLKRELFTLSTTIKGVSIDNLLEIATAGAKLGVANDELVAYTEGIAKVSTAIDDIPAGDLTDQIGKLNAVFKLGVQGAMQLGSAIDRVADSGASSASGILDVAQRLSGTAVGAQITAQESIALAGALLDTGARSEAAAEALLHLVAALNKAENHKGFATAIGTDAAKFAKTVKTKPVEAIFQFLDALKGLDDADRNTALSSIGIESIASAAAIKTLSEQVDTARRYTKLANEEFTSLNQINKSYGATARLTSAEITRQKNAFQVLSVELGTALLPATNAALGLAGDLVSGLNAAFTQSRSDAASWGVDVKSHVDSLGAGFRNIGPVFELAWVDFLEYGGRFIDVLTWISNNTGDVFRLIGQVLQRWYGIQTLAIMNLFETITSVIQEAWDYIRTMGKDPIKIQVKPIFEGHEALADQLKIAAPSWDKMPWTNLDHRRQEIMDRMVGNELATAQAKADAAAAKGIGPKKEPEKAEDKKSLAGESKGHAQTTDLDGFRKALQEGIFGKDKAAKDTAANTMRIAVAVEKIAGREPNPGVGLAGA